MDKQDMERDVMLANRFNMPTIAHCIGDRAVDEWLDVLQDHICPGNPLHHGIVHCQILREDQIRKIIDLNLSCYYQSIFIDYDASIVSERVGSQLAETSYPFHTLYEGTLCSNGSDAPVEMPDVMKGLECAVTRKSLSFPGKAMNPKECLSVEEAMGRAEELYADTADSYSWKIGSVPSKRDIMQILQYWIKTHMKWKQISSILSES